MSKLAKLNDMHLRDEGVYCRADVAAFNYSDGQDVEARLAKILQSAGDLSSQSTELENAIHDWPSEYHLTSKRANLLRPLNLAKVGQAGEHVKVLELGCGCGAITRYLGEQDQLEVDAIEGSLARANLAALRCRDLSNVTIHTANFNDLELPQGHYDMVLLVGVTEYAGRFSDEKTDQAALQSLLGLAKNALQPGGVALIAIENRLGLKYLLGASEDHYGQPWVGIDNYPESTGIRTYSKSEWLAEVANSDFERVRFCYPFPDYKVPSLLVNGEADDTPSLLKALSATQSRDYLKAFHIEDEIKLWELAVAQDGLGQLANSFLLLLGDDVQTIETLADFDLAEYAHEAYDWQRSSTLSTPAADAKQRLHTKIASLTEQNQQLEAQLELLKGSRGWRLVSTVRRLFSRVNNQ